MGLSKWVKQKMAIASLAMAGVEKNLLKQNGGDASQNIASEQSHMKGTVLDDLKQGRVSQEVMDLRWRMYKVLAASEKIKAVAHNTGNGKDMIGENTTFTFEIMDATKALSSVKLDSHDNYPLELSFDNSLITLGRGDVNFSSNFTGGTSESGGMISSEAFAFATKQERPLNIIRTALCNFEIENFTTKFNVRTINEKEKLIEFYVSKYPDEENRTSRLFLSALKKTIENPRNASMLEINEVAFVSDKTIGVRDFCEYVYEITSFDKIIEFNGFYVIKFKANVKVNGDYILEKYKQEELDVKYENKEKKKQR